VTFDIVFEDARIVDGTGSPWFRGAVAVDDGRIARIERGTGVDIDAQTTVAVEGNVLAPGFIDTHSHSDLKLFADPLLKPKLRQGITTEILGQDGFSIAPMYPEGGDTEWQDHLGGLAGRVDRDWTWESFSDYLDAVEENGVAPNVASHVGHGTVRYNVMGMADRRPTDDELDEMADLVTEALEEGALGLSTGLIYTPCTYDDTPVLERLASRLEPYGRPFVAHIRSEGRWIWDALDEFVDVGAEQSVPLHLSHFKVAGRKQHGKAGRAIDLLETARERGVDITVEQYPYTAASTMLSSVLPPWVHVGGAEQVLEQIEEPEVRERIRRDITEWRIEGWENTAGLAGWDGIVVSNVESDANEHLEGRTVAEIADERDASPVDAVCDLLLEENLDVSMVLDLLAEDDVREILGYERVNACTDGLFGGSPHPRVYGTYPRILGHYVREENVLTLEEAIRKMTALPARAMGLERKGVLRPGMDADLVVFDPEVVESPATYENPKQYPRGIPHVVVEGEPVVSDGEVTGRMPGRVIRK